MYICNIFVDVYIRTCRNSSIQHFAPSNEELLVRSYAMMAAAEPRKYCRVKARYFSWPAVSHRCSSTDLPFGRSCLCGQKQQPTVANVCSSKLPRCSRCNRLVLPTPESPTNMTLAAPA